MVRVTYHIIPRVRLRHSYSREFNQLDRIVARDLRLGSLLFFFLASDSPSIPFWRW
jgi:hypothetical protein